MAANPHQPTPDKPHAVQLHPDTLRLLGGVGVVVLAASLLGAETSSAAIATLIGVLDAWTRGALAPAALLLAAYGLGTLGDRLWATSTERHLLRLGVGLSLMLTLIHGLGVLGMLSAPVSFGLVGVGLGLVGRTWLGWQRTQSTDAPLVLSLQAGRLGGWAWLLVVPVGLGMVASASPPGWLWGSEFGGYDALSYHLPLPQEWLRTGKIWPAAHNVYSYLPSYLEATSVPLAHLTLAPIDGVGLSGEPGHGLTAGTGWRAVMPQTLHWMLSVLSAWAVGRVTWRLAAAAPERAPAAAWLAAAMVLATPWVLVVGTLAYNEMAVVLLGAVAMLAALDEKLGPYVRTGLAALLVGAACGCKPTAILFIAPVVGVALVWQLPKKALLPAVGLGCVVGLMTLAPWLVRNMLASGNPVFPAAAGLFGTGHWDAAAVARYAEAHRFQGGLLDRLRLLVWSDPGAPAGSPSVRTWRGMANPQWGLLAGLGVVALGVLLSLQRTHIVGFVLGLGLLLQCAIWLAFTHLQSRFLLPSVLVLAPAIGLLSVWAPWKWAFGRVLLTVVVGVQIGLGVMLLSAQGGGHPNSRTAVGAGVELGRPYQPGLGAVSPSAFANHELPKDAKLYLLGDATPFYYEVAVVYNTTYDPWPLGEAVRAHPAMPAQWIASLRGRGITHVLLALPELARLSESGWMDPALTPAVVEAWIAGLGDPLQTWADPQGRVLRVLYALPEAGGLPESAGDPQQAEERPAGA